MTGTDQLSREIETYFDRLWPLRRSLSGAGSRETHRILGELVPLATIEFASGTQCFDWTVPQEWEYRTAYVIGPDGSRVIDADGDTLRLVSYSAPFRGTVTREELDAHLHSAPDMPDALPYVTTYYRRDWGFAVTQRERDALPDGQYEVVVDTEFTNGAISISEALLPGETSQEVLISTYTCHPSMANDNLSGPLVAAFLYRELAALPSRRLSYRFVWLPETIGAIAYLSRRGDLLRERLLAGYVVSCAGDPGPFTYKESRRGTTLADRAAKYVLTQRTETFNCLPFNPNGSDERQYCSPGFDLPVGVIARSIYGQFPEYHTSLDNRDFISFDALAESVQVYRATMELLDRNTTPVRTMPECEPQLGKYGLYPMVGGARTDEIQTPALQWVLNLADGQHDLLAVAERSGIEFDAIYDAASACAANGLLEDAG